MWFTYSLLSLDHVPTKYPTRHPSNLPFQPVIPICRMTRNFCHQEFQVPKMEVLNLEGYFGGGFSLTKALYTAYIGEYLHFRYLKCLVILAFWWISDISNSNISNSSQPTPTLTPLNRHTFTSLNVPHTPCKTHLIVRALIYSLMRISY